MAIFQDLFLVLILTEVDDKKRFLGHSKKIKKSQNHLAPCANFLRIILKSF